MLVRDLMTPHTVCVETKEPVRSAARLMQSRNIGVLPVCDARGNIAGMLTDRDVVIRCVAAGVDPDRTSVEQIMSRGAVTAAPEDDVNEALRHMQREQIRRLPVVENGKLVGMLSLADVARTSRFDMEAARALSGITSNVCRR